LVQAWFEGKKRDTWTAWLNTDIDSTAKRENIFFIVKAVEALKADLQFTVETGKSASAMLNKLDERKEKE